MPPAVAPLPSPALGSPLGNSRLLLPARFPPPLGTDWKINEAFLATPVILSCRHNQLILLITPTRKLTRAFLIRFGQRVSPPVKRSGGGGSSGRLYLGLGFPWRTGRYLFGERKDGNKFVFGPLATFAAASEKQSPGSGQISALPRWRWPKAGGGEAGRKEGFNPSLPPLHEFARAINEHPAPGASP